MCFDGEVEHGEGGDVVDRVVFDELCFHRCKGFFVFIEPAFDEFVDACSICLSLCRRQLAVCGSVKEVVLERPCDICITF